MTRGKPVLPAHHLGHRRCRVRVLSYHDESVLERRVRELEDELMDVKHAKNDPEWIKRCRAETEEARKGLKRFQKLAESGHSRAREAEQRLAALRPAEEIRHVIMGLDDVLRIAIHHASLLPKNSHDAKKLWAALSRLHQGFGRALKPPLEPRVECPLHDAGHLGDQCYCDDKPEWQRKEDKIKRLQRMMDMAKSAGLLED